MSKYNMEIHQKGLPTDMAVVLIDFHSNFDILVTQLQKY